MSSRTAHGSAHLLCAADLREAYAVAEQTDKGEFASSIVAEGNQIRTNERWPDLTTVLHLARERTDRNRSCCRCTTG
jgi:hypothetical protein